MGSIQTNFIMAFLLDQQLGTDITSYIYQFTKPKSIESYRDVLCLDMSRNQLGQFSNRGFISQLLRGIINDYNFQEIAYHQPNLFTKNIGYLGYSLFLGVIDLSHYPDVIGSLRMFLVFDEFPLTPVEIIVLDDESTIVNRYSLKENLVLSGVLSGLNFHYNIVEKTKLNTLELEYWNRLIDSSTKLTNTYLEKHFDHKISLSYNNIKGESETDDVLDDYRQSHLYYDYWSEYDRY